MEIINLEDHVDNRYEIAVALGNFDGLHIGHKFLIEDNIKKSKSKGLKAAVLLFKNHTKTVIKNQNNKKINLLTPYEQKLRLLNDLGIDLVYVMKFDKIIMELSADKFISEILVKKLNTKLVSVGFDYKFGYKALGDCNYLKKLSTRYGFEMNIVKPIYFNEEIVSSTSIRNLIKIGNIEKANKFLGRSYSIMGRVIEGKNFGSKLGYPTANIELVDYYIIPKEGVYQTIVTIEEQKYLGLTNIGYNPTFDEKELKIENHILGFDRNIYGKIINVEFIKYIRKCIKFDTIQELIEQIGKDIGYVKKGNNIYNY